MHLCRIYRICTLFSKISLLTSPINLCCGGLTIEQIESIKHPGVVIDSLLNMDLHITHIAFLFVLF